MFKKYCCFIVFAVILNFSTFSKTLAIACFQNEDADEQCKNITGKFEDFLFEPFFESGFIVTSVPPADIKSHDKIKYEEIQKFFEEPAEYFLICYMQYGKDLIFNKTLDKKIPDWKILKVSLINFATSKEIYSKVFEINKIKENDPEKKGETVSIKVAKDVIEVINKKNKEQ